MCTVVFLFVINHVGDILPSVSYTTLPPASSFPLLPSPFSLFSFSFPHLLSAAPSPSATAILIKYKYNRYTRSVQIRINGSVIKKKYREMGPLSFEEAAVGILLLMTILLWILRNPPGCSETEGCGWEELFHEYREWYVVIKNHLFIFLYLKTTIPTLSSLHKITSHIASSCTTTYLTQVWSENRSTLGYNSCRLYSAFPILYTCQKHQKARQ